VEAKEQYLINSQIGLLLSITQMITRTRTGIGKVSKRLKISAMTSLGFYLLKQHMPWIDEEYFKPSHNKEDNFFLH
jgi:hypothetical protein